MKEIDIRTFTQVSLLLASLATSVNWSGETHRESWAAPGSPIEMNYIATIPSPARLLLSTPLGFDLDHDGQREFVLRVWEFSSIPGASGLLELYESTADDTFALVHVLDLVQRILSARE
jgi:hypothetical protein